MVASVVVYAPELGTVTDPLGDEVVRVLGVTLRVNVQVPEVPPAADVVPLTTYVPTLSDPVVVMVWVEALNNRYVDCPEPSCV